MSSAGHIMDMIRKMEQNRAAQKAMGGAFRHNKKTFRYSSENDSTPNPHLKKYTPQEREALRIRIFKEESRERILKNLYTFLVVAGLSLVMYLIFK
jgi:hypothetical protein